MFPRRNNKRHTFKAIQRADPAVDQNLPRMALYELLGYEPTPTVSKAITLMTDRNNPRV
jgi:hypothetical protein